MRFAKQREYREQDGDYDKPATIAKQAGSQPGKGSGQTQGCQQTKEISHQGLVVMTTRKPDDPAPPVTTRSFD